MYLGFGVLATLLGGMLATLAWVFATEQGTRSAFDYAAKWLGNNTTQVLDIELDHGSILQGLAIRQLAWRDGERYVAASALELELDWSAMWRNTLRIEKLHVQSLTMAIPPSEDDDPPFVLPDQISSPVDVLLESLKIERILFNDFPVNELHAGASLSNGEFNLATLGFNAQSLAVQSSLKVNLTKPYPLQGELSGQRDFDGLDLKADLQAGGSLERLELLLNAAGQNTSKPAANQNLKLDAVVLPFSPSLIERLDLAANDFNPQAWLDTAPRATLNIRGNVSPNDGLTAATGSFSIANTTPLSMQAGGLPFSLLRLAADLQTSDGLPDTLKLNVIELLLTDGRRNGGRVTAMADWKAAQAENKKPDTDPMKGRVDFSLQTRGLDASMFAALQFPLSINSDVTGRYQNGQLDVSKLEITDQDSRVAGVFNVGLQGRMPVKADVNFVQVNPARYVPNANALMQGSLNGAVAFQGELRTGNSKDIRPAGQLSARLTDSTLANSPLGLNLDLDGSQTELKRILLDMDLAGNFAKASGSYGRQNDFIEVDVNFAQLGRLGRLMKLNLGGTARLKGQLRGVNGDFSGDGTVQVRQLRLDDMLAIDDVSGDFSLGSSPQSPWTGNLQIVNVSQPGNASRLLNSLNMQLAGVRQQHELKVTADTGLTTFSRQRPIKAQLAMKGGVRNIDRGQETTQAWVGVLSALKLEGMWSPARSFVLQQAAPLVLSPALVEVTNLSIQGEDSSLIANRILQIKGKEIRIEGEMPKFSFPRLSPILRKQMTVEPKDLVVKAAWRYIANPARVDGHVDVTHVSGGLQVLEDSQIDVDIRKLQANLDFNRDAASLSLDIEADDFGVVSANLRLPVQQNAQTKSWGLAGNKPMQGAVAAGFTDLSWLGPLISGGVRTSGTGQVAMAIGGTADSPDVQGRLFGMNLNVFQIDQGVRLEEGNVVVDFTTDRATIETFDFTVYNRQPPRRQIEQLGSLIQGHGKITATGQWNLTGLNGELQVKLDRVPLLQRPDRWLMVDTTASVQQPLVEGQPLKIRGQINALGAYFEMPESGPQTLGDDVFIQGRSEVVSAGLPVDLQLQANLGDRFYLNAEGLRTRLSGGLRLVMLEGVGGSGQRRSGRRLTATGTIQTVDGTYRAYGQDLTIERGVVNFQGPIDNPGLNVRAVRKGVAVEAGVEVTGTAQRPKVALVSDPAVPDSEKLSWMIIGRGSNSADRDSTLLLTAAAAIFGDDDDSTTRKIARAVGIDDLTLSTGSLTAADSRAVGSKVAIAPGADDSATIIGADDPLLSQRIISLGKRLSDQVYLSFDQSVTTAASIFKLNYQYSRQLSLIARTGADNAVDVLYQLSFD